MVMRHEFMIQVHFYNPPSQRICLDGAQALMAGQGFDPRDFLWNSESYSLYTKLAGAAALRGKWLEAFEVTRNSRL